jgi:hypothetical protein
LILRFIVGWVNIVGWGSGSGGEGINSSWGSDFGYLFISVGGSRSHGSSRVSSLLLPLPVGGCKALRTLSKQEVGRLISVRRELMLSERGNLGGRVDCCACFGVILVLVGFSLETVARVVIPMVEYDWN